jgi:hypothetical protein
VLYSRTVRPTLTASSELFLEHYSCFFYFRDTVRLFVRRFIPGYQQMVEDWNSFGLPVQPNREPETGAAFVEKLSNLKLACGPHARFVLLIAPTRQHVDEALEPELRSAAGRLGIPVVEPIGEKEWPAANFRDGYHLNLAAAREFSRLVGADLVNTINADEDRQ